MKEVKFEEAMQALETIAKELEKGDLPLEESISKFEEGMKLATKCNTMIEEAEKKICILLQKDGKMIEEKFEVEE